MERLGLVEKVWSGALLVDRREIKLPVSRFHDLRFLPHPNFPGAEDVFSRMQTAPKFVFSRDVMDWLVEHSGDYVRIPMKPDGYSDAKPDRHSNLMPDAVPI